MLHQNNHDRYYFYNEVVDMRKGCYGLCGIVQNELKKNILLGDVFVFINKRHNQIKLLQWDTDGFALYEKRLEKALLNGLAKHKVVQMPCLPIYSYNTSCRASY